MKQKKRFSLMGAVLMGITGLLLLTACESKPKVDSVEFTGKGMNLIQADQPEIGYIGRIDFSDPKAPSFSYPGTQISTGFTGQSIAVKLQDYGVKNFYSVMIDGKEYGPLSVNESKNLYFITGDLTQGEHRIDLIKRTESLCGTTTFEGFLIDKGEILKPLPSEPDKLIEFVGDSITCGYGNLVSTTDPNSYHFTPKNEDNTQSWGAFTAKALDSNYIATSFSGRGMVRNLDGNTELTMPEVYGYVFPDFINKVEWNASAMGIDMIVINLGTNDYSWEGFQNGMVKEEFDAQFLETYQNFIANLRSIHGADLPIICVVGPMMSNGYPPNRQAWTRIKGGVSSMVENLKTDGDSNIYYLALTPQSSPYGEDWHPTVATHRKMADQLTSFITKNIDGWE